MELLIERCAGIDVGKKELRVCARVPGPQGVQEIIESFGTTTPDLEDLRDWLVSHGVTHVAMESTGVYWKCVMWILEDHFDCILVNANHVKHVPGRKTDTIDAAWLAQLLAHGLLRASFIPPRPVRELRDLTRDRKALINDHTRLVNRVHRILEDAGVKLASVATDIMGVSGRAMLAALISGQRDPAVLADMAKGRMRPKVAALTKALTAPGFGEHHGFELSSILELADTIDRHIVSLSCRIAQLAEPWEPIITLLCSIPGVDRRSAEVILAEIGPDMTVFPTSGHLGSWAGLCPGQRESAGKRGSARTRKGSKWLRAALVQSARAAARSKETYLSERYRQVLRRRGDHKAIVAVAHDILTSAWWLITTGELYSEAGTETLRKTTNEHVRRRAIRQLEQLGYQVTVSPTPAT